MKTLEQLGASPAPWEVAMDDIAMVFSGSQYPSLSTPHICEVDIIDDPERKCNDIKLIAAAPELYKCLHEAVVGICHNFECCGPYPEYACNGSKDCFVKHWRAALAKAAGEEVGGK